MADRAEDVVKQMRYNYFDAAIEHYLNQEKSLEEAVAEYQRRIGAIAVAGSAD